MANLTNTIRWQKYTPLLGENREQPIPFYVEIATGLTRAQMREIEAARDATPLRREDFDSDEAFLDAELRRLEQLLAPFVRLGKEPLVVNDKPVNTLFDLLKVYAELVTGVVALSELPAVVRHLNSPAGQHQMMLARVAEGFDVANGKKR